MCDSGGGVSLQLGEYQPRVERRLRAWETIGFVWRLWKKDPTLWSRDPHAPEVTDRLGWLDLPETARARVAEWQAFADEVRGEGFGYVVLLGMGGSSLAPEVFQRTFGSAAGSPELIVLDSTHPEAVRAVERRLDLRRTLFLVSSKSGTTVEPLALLRYFWSRTHGEGRRFATITDPRTPLERLAAEWGFRRIFLAPSDVGGRYSALSDFGLLPAALIGVRIGEILESSRRMAAACAPDRPPQENPGLVLGAALSELALAGRDKLTLFTSPALESFPEWIEQLVAESSGKDGQGIVPVAAEPLGLPDTYGPDRVFVWLALQGDREPAVLESLALAGHPVIGIRLGRLEDLGGEFFRWEFATASACAALGIHPFNQPDVQLAKDLARHAIEQGTVPDSPQPLAAGDVERLGAALHELLATARPGRYLAFQAYLAPSQEITDALNGMRRVLRDRLRVATTSGYGPRFLHSTGQLHKGGPDTGLFLQFMDEPSQDLEVPDARYTFGQLLRAQADGDAAALWRRGRALVRVHLGRDAAAGLHCVEEAISAASRS